MGIIRVLAAGTVVLVAGAVAGCAGEASGGSAATGAVHGMITMTGGPRGASPVGAAGTVIAKVGGKRVARQDVAEGQQFSFRLPAGTYQLSVSTAGQLAVSTAGQSCVDAPVTIVPAADQDVALVCSGYGATVIGGPIGRRRPAPPRSRAARHR